MLDFSKKVIDKADNEVMFCGIHYTITDDEALKLKDILDAMVSSRSTGKTTSKPATVLHVEPEKTTQAPIPGKKMWEEDFCTVTYVDGKYRLYIHCPVQGTKGQFIRDAIKKSAKDYTAKFSGDYSKKIFHWTFESNDGAKTFIDGRKEYAKKHKK